MTDRPTSTKPHTPGAEQDDVSSTNCSTFYRKRPRSLRSETIAERFETRYHVEPNTGCWLWTGSLNGVYGYGTLTFAHRTQPAHRLSYELHKGPIPAGMQIDHLCRQRCCVNPDHLEAVTQQENIRRGARVSEQTCRNGHPRTPENTYWYDATHRVCRACRTANNTRHRHGLAKPNRRTRITRPITSEVPRG